MRLCPISDSIYRPIVQLSFTDKRRISIQPYVFRDLENESAIQGFLRMGPKDQDTIPNGQAHWPFLSPEDVLVLFRIKSRDFWAGPTGSPLFTDFLSNPTNMAENTKRILCACPENRVSPEITISSYWPKGVWPPGTGMLIG